MSPADPVAVSRSLARRVGSLAFGPPVSHVYDPTRYARAGHELYLRRYAKKRTEALLLGMNPGPFGMAQSGIPFGDVVMVREWLEIEAPVHKPRLEHPKRPVEGLDCRRREVSGTRLWGWARERFETPDRFFARFFVWNYCPLCFMEESGRNRTPDKLPAAERKPLFDGCDRALRDLVSLLEPRRVIGVGAFAAARARHALGDRLPVGTILHPSPASPAANRGWAPQVEKQLRDLGIEI
jgi:single-strand selective monofunctional uracil DNA glycosylase